MGARHAPRVVLHAKSRHMRWKASMRLAMITVLECVYFRAYRGVRCWSLQRTGGSAVQLVRELNAGPGCEARERLVEGRGDDEIVEDVLTQEAGTDHAGERCQ